MSRMNISPVDRIKLILGLVLLMPIRLVLVLALFVLCPVVGYLLVLVTTITGHRHLTYTQSTFKRRCLNLTSSITALGMYIAGLRVEVDDRREDNDKSSTKGIVVTAPHSSPFDFGAMIAIGPMTGVAKQEDIWSPFIGCHIFLSNAILVKRNDTESRRQVIKDIADRCGQQEVGISPEATVTDGSSLIRFKLGAFIPGLPVSPVTIGYTYNGTVNNVSWTWQGPGLFTLLVLSCASWSNTVSKVTRLPIYLPDEAEKSCPQLYANNVRRYMATSLNIPVTRYMFEDAFFLQFAKKAMVSYSPICLKCIKLAYKLTTLQTVNYEGSPLQPIVTNNNLGSDIKHRLKATDDERGQCQYENESNYWEKLSQEQIYKRLITNTNKKVTNLLDAEPFLMSSEIVNQDGLLQVLVLPVEVGTNEIKTVLVDLVDSMKLNPGSVVTYNHLLLFLTLMDSSIDIWTRIAKYTLLVKRMTSVNDNEALKYLLWYLIGIEEDQLDINLLNEYELNYEFLKRNLKVNIRTAVNENCAHLFLV